jgi:hypothetical protein
MSNVIGPISRPFMGRELGLRQRNLWGSRLTGMVVAEVERLVNNTCVTAKYILTENMELVNWRIITNIPLNAPNS